MYRVRSHSGLCLYDTVSYPLKYCFKVLTQDTTQPFITQIKRNTKRHIDRITHSLCLIDSMLMSKFSTG